MNQKKKKGLVALVILLVVAIGVGFAAASQDNLKISGKASAATDFDIQFKTDATIGYAKVERTDVNDAIKVEGEYTDKDNATITVSNLKHVNDYASATFTVVNKSPDVAANVTADVTTEIADADHYEVTTTMADGSENVAKNGGTTTVTVTVKLLKAFADNDEAKTEQSFTVTVTGTAVEK